MKTILPPILRHAWFFVLALALNGCASAPYHRAAVRDDSTDRLTVGTVQKDIHVGMTGAEVVAVLGAPNIVTTDDERREVWTYDKISSETVTSSGSVGLFPSIFAIHSPWGGGVAASGSQSAGATATTQRTLTVVIKFDAQKRVRDFAYHASTF